MSHPREPLHIVARADSHQRRDNPRSNRGGGKGADRGGRGKGAEGRKGTHTSGKVDYRLEEFYPARRSPSHGRFGSRWKHSDLLNAKRYYPLLSLPSHCSKTMLNRHNALRLVIPPLQAGKLNGWKLELTGLP